MRGRKMKFVILGFFGLIIMPAVLNAAVCVSLDTGFPPPCPYENPDEGMVTEVQGPVMDPETSIEFHGKLTNHQSTSSIKCNALGCRIETFESTLEMDIIGTGDLSGLQRFLIPTVVIEVHTGSQSSGAGNRTVQTEIVSMSLAGGGLFGDPDFDFLNITAGSDFGLPSPGETTLTRLGDGTYQVDSFFDITYRIEFIGALGSILEGMSGDSTGRIRMRTPGDVEPHFMIGLQEEWEKALAAGPGESRVRPMDPNEWLNYISQFNDPNNLDGNEPYPPDTNFLVPDLYVAPCDGNSGLGGCIEGGPSAALLMTWGGRNLPDGEYAAAWVYEYDVDPDLSSSSVSIDVEAPCGMMKISLGVKDAAGFIRSWVWDVGPVAGPGTIQCSPDPNTGLPVMTTITVDLSSTGATAATPTASSYSSAIGFSISSVVAFTFDEDMMWVASAGVPPPGIPDPKPFNYWYDLTVTPNVGGGGGTDIDSKWFVKWSQPPVETADGFINGWDERSNYWTPPLIADDWECNDARPVTDVHWWGSFIGWTQPYPPILPKAFHLGIWTDISASTSSTGFSHPGTMVWENYCTSFVWNFAGYDQDPRVNDPNCQENEACFQFAQFLNQDEWFHQEPMDDGTPNVYWLSIAPIYDPNAIVQHPWGWKSRPHYFNDDAVRTFSVSDPTGVGIWPPHIGSIWDSGEEILLAEESWDMSFELTTNEPNYMDNPIPGDISGPVGDPDGAVNLWDFIPIAINWGNIAVFAIP